jgi:hypothetical protein
MVQSILGTSRGAIHPASFEDGTLTIHLIESVRWQEQEGKVVEIQDAAIVSDIPAVHQGDEEIIQAALAHTSMPVFGDSHPKIAALKLVDRSARSRGVATVSVDLTYRLPGAEVQPPAGAQFMVSGGSAVEQIETELDRDGVQVTVQHNGDTQGGTITPLEARDVLTLEAPQQQTVNPWFLARDWVNRVNDGPFAFDPDPEAYRKWLITNISFELIDPNTTPWTYRYRYELRHNEHGHDPQIVYIDPATGRPPPGLVVWLGDPSDPAWDTAGAKIVPWHEEKDFTILFG